MEFIQKTEKKLLSAYEKLTATPKDLRLVSIMIYTLLFGIGYVFLIMPIVKETGSIISFDGSTQYFPLLVGLRRDIVSFFSNISNGSFEFPMINFGFFFGGDTVTSEVMMFLPFLPIYALSALLPEELTMSFFAFAIIFILYLSGLSFWNMCRYFQKNLLLTGVISVFYVFCGSLFFTLLWNPQFLVMSIAFPFMIIGIDKILHDKSGLALTLSIAWVSLTGFVFLIYTLPFAALFALIRLLHVKKEKPFANSLKYFSIGILHIIVGILLASVTFIPGMISFLCCQRSVGNSEISILSLFIPSASQVTALVNSRSLDDPISVSSAVIPAFLYTIISNKPSKEYKWYSAVVLALVSLPFIWYGINGFLYPLCRWGFVPTLYMCYVSVDLLPKMIKSDKKDILRFTVFSGAVLVSFLIGLNIVGSLLIGLAAIITLIPPLERAIGKLFSFCFGKVKDVFLRIYRSRYRYLLIMFLCAVAICIIFGIISLFVYKIFVPLISLLVALIVACTAGFLSIRGKDVRSVISFCMCVLLSLSSVFYYGSIYYNVAMVSLNPIYDAIKSLKTEDDTFGRFAAIKKESENDLLSKEGVEQNKYMQPSAQIQLAHFDNFSLYSDANIDLSLKYDLPDSEGFLSVLDGDFNKFMDRCGQDVGSMVSNVYFDGFSGKEPLYSMFGVKYFYSSLSPENPMYGITEIDTRNNELLERISVFKNDYVLPAGITYDNIMSKQWYDSMSSAELPFGIMDGVYLEDYDGAVTDPSESDSGYSIACDTVFDRTIISTDDFGMESANNKLTLKDDVSGCFLYLSLEDVDLHAETGVYGKRVVFSKDGKKSAVGLVESQNWPWRRGIHSYTFALGYTENKINTIDFYTEFNFDINNVKLTAIPKEVYIDLYNARSKEAMTDLSMSTNTLTGKVNVSSDKVLSIGLLHNDGWTAYVDGEKTKTYNANGVFIGFPIKAGSHDIKLVYRTPGLYEGALISAIVIITFITAEIILYRKRNKAIPHK